MQHVLIDHGYLALVLLGFIEACCVPIPSEVTFGFAGVLAASGKLELWVVILLGSAAEILGSLVAYSVGRFGGRPLVERVGRYVLITSRDLDRAERWFSGRGEFAVLIGRAMPVIRAFVSLAAGIADMPVAKFLVFGGLGTLLYATTLASIGGAVGTCVAQGGARLLCRRLRVRGGGCRGDHRLRRPSRAGTSTGFGRGKRVGLRSLCVALTLGAPREGERFRQELIRALPSVVVVGDGDDHNLVHSMRARKRLHFLFHVLRPAEEQPSAAEL